MKSFFKILIVNLLNFLDGFSEEDFTFEIKNPEVQKHFKTKTTFLVVTVV